jgi:hypothetical protein
MQGSNECIPHLKRNYEFSIIGICPGLECLIASSSRLNGVGIYIDWRINNILRGYSGDILGGHNYFHRRGIDPTIFIS